MDSPGASTSGVEVSAPASPSWTRGLSQGSIPRPGLPNISNLRAALLGYISEVERAVRESVSGQGEEDPNARFEVAGSPSSTSGLSTSGDEQDAFGSSSAVAGPSSGLRYRMQGLAGYAGESSAAGQAGQAGQGPDILPHSSILQHLNTLREDVTNYLPSRLSVPSPPHLNLGARGDWLRNLPYKLRMVDLSVAPLPPDHRTPSSPDIDHGAVEHARRKVIELAKAYLPSEEWAGWERLGWEEQDSGVDTRGSSRRHSFDLGLSVPVEPEEEEEEPEYLFPNRTPASAQAFASRRRAVRSKSLGAANFPVQIVEELKPKLARTQTEPSRRKEEINGSLAVLDGGEDEEDSDIDTAELLVHPEFITDLKLANVVSATTLGPTVADALEKAEGGSKLITFEDLPFIWRNNEHILTGYRFIPLHASTGPIPLIKSAFSWHNETVNIHSHFIPTILILLFIPAMIYTSPLPDAHFLDTATLVVYLLAAASCLISSAGWHVLAGCAYRKWFEWGACVDYIGISWLIAASFFTVLYNAFYCDPKTVLAYSTVNLTCGALGSYLPFQKWFNERKNKNWRIGFFLFLCFAMFAPMLQLFVIHGWERGRRFTAPFGASIIAYAVGLLFYAFHWPECVWPGRFDRWGASHHLWHAGIVIAIVLHYNAIFAAHNLKYEYSCAMPNAGMPVGEVVEKGWWMVMRALGVET